MEDLNIDVFLTKLSKIRDDEVTPEYVFSCLEDMIKIQADRKLELLKFLRVGNIFTRFESEIAEGLVTVDNYIIGAIKSIIEMRKQLKEEENKE